MINNNLFKNLPNNWLKFIQTLFKKILDTEQTPEEQCMLSITPIYKKKRTRLTLSTIDS